MSVESIANAVRSGGNPYILVTALEDGTVDLVTAGFTTEEVRDGLYEVADQLAAHIIREKVQNPA
jgi:hypothetical protein